MSVIVWYFADASAAVYGLAGALIGGVLTGAASLLVARKTRIAAEHSWVRDSRRKIYDRFLVAGQSLLHEMETAKATDADAERVRATIDPAYSTFVGTYASVQTVAKLDAVQSARVQMYLLEALKSILDRRDWFESDQFDRIAELVRFARQDTIDGMRADLDLDRDGSAKPQTDKKYTLTYKEAVSEAVADAKSKHPHRGAAP